VLGGVRRTEHQAPARFTKSPRSQDGTQAEVPPRRPSARAAWRATPAKKGTAAPTPTKSTAPATHRRCPSANQAGGPGGIPQHELFYGRMLLSSQREGQVSRSTSGSPSGPLSGAAVPIYVPLFSASELSRDAAADSGLSGLMRRNPISGLFVGAAGLARRVSKNPLACRHHQNAGGIFRCLHRHEARRRQRAHALPPGVLLLRLHQSFYG